MQRQPALGSLPLVENQISGFYQPGQVGIYRRPEHEPSPLTLPGFAEPPFHGSSPTSQDIMMTGNSHPDDEAPIFDDIILWPNGPPEAELYRQHSQGTLASVIIPSVQNSAQYREFVNNRPANIVFNVKIKEKRRVRGAYPTILVDQISRLYYPDLKDFDSFVDKLLGSFAIDSRERIRDLKAVAKKEGSIRYDETFSCNEITWSNALAELRLLGIGARTEEGINMAHKVSLFIFLL